MEIEQKEYFMTEKDMKDRLNAVFNALESIQVSGMKNVQSMAGSMSVLLEVINSPILQEPVEE